MTRPLTDVSVEFLQAFRQVGADLTINPPVAVHHALW
jgi:hypothetical protein